MRRFLAVFFTGLVMVAGVNTMADAHSGDSAREARLKHRISVLKERNANLRERLDKALYGPKPLSNNQCSSTSTCKPEEYFYTMWGRDDVVYRVRFVETIGADQYRWTAGPFWSDTAATKAAERLASSSGIPDQSVRIEVLSGGTWQQFAE